MVDDDFVLFSRYWYIQQLLIFAHTKEMLAELQSALLREPSSVQNKIGKDLFVHLSTLTNAHLRMLVMEPFFRCSYTLQLIPWCENLYFIIIKYPLQM